MNGTRRKAQEYRYAVAVRDNELYLVLRIRRSPKCDIFVLVPRRDPTATPRMPSWNPHASYHADGRLHVKTFDQVTLPPRQLAKPDGTFQGIQELWTMGVAVDEPKILNIPCNVKQYSDIFEIPVGDLRLEKYRTHLVIHVAAPGEEPKMPDGSVLIRRRIFKDSTPWLMVALYDFAWLLD